jgi:hypothetical protein
VHSRDISAEYHLPPGTMGENVRYCNDRPACVEAAQTFRLTARPVDERTDDSKWRERR